MDPVSAFGLAASVINFVTFASTLISKSTEIAQSTTGLSEDFSNAETLYNRLQELSTDLGVCAGADESEDGELKKQLATVVQLARSCKADCDILLGLVAKARVGDGPRRNWRSLQAALQAPWRGAGISKLEDRLKKTQTTLTLQLCSISSYYHATHLKYLKDIKTEASRLQCNQSSKLDGIKTTLDCIQQRITAIKRDQNSSVRPFLLADIDRIEQQLAVLDIAESDIQKAHSILESLDFERRTARYSNIKPAHQETFEWIFRGHKNNGTHFAEWMKNGNSVFWVSGKPGSGKSTLMKFVAAHPRTVAELSIWSYPRPIFIASHYFWSAGNELQKSEQGLLQTLLHDIFCQRPELVETCCTERCLDALPIKFCFFIDGLDEYSGDLTDICQAVHDLSQSPNIKLCISSRPWNVFRDSFGTDPSRKLDIHDLTSDDIIRYTRFRLHQHPRWRVFASDFPNADSLIYEIAKRSQGVFLWVFLVTQRLRDGLYNNDNLLDMQNRLKELPTDLEPFFRHILEKVDPIYNEKMSGMLCIAIKANMPLHHSIYHFHSCEYDDEDYCLHIPVELLDDKRAEAQYIRIKRRLNGWCMGLLEVRQGQVDFLHRSVMDYLRTAEMSKFLKSKNKKNFDANLSLLRAYTAWIKTTSSDQKTVRHGPGRYNDVPIMTRTIAALEYAKDIEEEQAQENHLDQRSAKNALLDIIEATLCKIEQRDGWRLSKKSGACFNGAQLFFLHPSRLIDPLFRDKDVTLGAELGALPYKNTSINSIYQGLNGDEDGATLGSVIGARVNEAVMAINPSLPYIYLPRGTCEAAAANLPVTWNENLGLYTWDTNDPKYEQIVRSSAFLGFSLVDRNRMHFVIKVPFRVLNLTLTPPMVDNPTQYFPCKPSNSSQYAGFWQLGRAFLQAAFVGVTYEHSTAFLAQAPGPNGDGSVLKEISREASEIESSNIEWFQRSWNSSWMVLEETGPESPSRGPTTPITKALSPGAIGGITVGSVAFVIVLATVSILWWRFKRRSAAAKLLPVYTPEPTATIGKSRFELPISERLNVLGEIIPAEMPDQNWQPPELADKKLD
ncbi:hypothetical protein NUW58_g2100 [Xylaria curta]|uniref:Uncharacterized protein n=1 Tax=Xylaria curta TaxID=42375 RepID=A0ACC1PH75_9PEZI|nr:hypothetical protein NUW58_g2100 [Xylaria curta]